jgi:hypothetical protein
MQKTKTEPNTELIQKFSQKSKYRAKTKKILRSKMDINHYNFDYSKFLDMTSKTEGTKEIHMN